MRVALPPTHTNLPRIIEKIQLRSSFPQPTKKAASSLELGLLGLALFLNFFGLRLEDFDLVLGKL